MPSLRSRAALPAVLIASTLALAACGGKPAGPAQAPAAAVTVVTLQPAPVTLTRELGGRAEASQVAEVRPQAGGIVERLLFTEGGSVQAGQPLYQLDQTAYRADADSARAAVARAQAELGNARSAAERAARLAKTQMISGQDNDNAQAALLQAQAGLRAAQAGLRSANVPLGFTRVTAPISGRIGRSSVTRGALVSAGQATPLAVIQDLDPMYVEINQSSTELLQLRREIAAGNLQDSASVPVDITLEDGSRYPQQGRLSFAEAVVDPRTGAVALRVVVPNPDQLLLPGMFVRATLANAQRRDALLAPQQGITRDPKGNATALVVGDDGKVQQRQVVVSRAIGDKWLVESGLKAGDRLIVEGLQKIAPGASVNASEATAAAAKPAAQPAAP